MTTAAPEIAPTRFEALIVPHRSLSRRGALILCSAMGVASAVLAVRFWFIGAWPVAGFAFAELGLAVFLLRLNYQRARASELLLLSDATLRIVRTDWHGRRREYCLPTAWLRVRLEDRPATIARLVVADRSGEVEVGASLGDGEKRDLAAALAAALERARNPRFDNPQLREDSGIR